MKKKYVVEWSVVGGIEIEAENEMQARLMVLSMNNTDRLAEVINNMHTFETGTIEVREDL